MQMRARWTILVFFVVLAIGMVAQATHLRCYVVDHCCCAEDMQDDCKANSLQAPNGSVAVAIFGPPVVVQWDLIPLPLQREQIQAAETLPPPRELLCFQPWGLRAPPPVRFSA